MCDFNDAVSHWGSLGGFSWNFRAIFSIFLLDTSSSESAGAVQGRISQRLLTGLPWNLLRFFGRAPKNRRDGFPVDNTLVPDKETPQSEDVHGPQVIDLNTDLQQLGK